ncbi:azurin [Pseudoalteromonas sp. Isolate6]|uniref:azurin n=1 Tax=Pseudoalteromonas sp. Isolate6 TaxID=2908527 RepID=UPI001EFDCFAD|nr:azurin [Pseudoalteromonas sp. Isolate6]MCG9759264.1 azurin [Pseudoalteromonas sp. Isolate6]
MKTSLSATLLSLGAFLFSHAALANECELSIEANDMMQFSKKSLSAPSSCKEISVTLKHTGKLAATTMGHNWVLSKAADVQAVATDGMSAGANNSYVKPNDSRVLAVSKVIGGGEQTTVTFSTEQLKKDESYKFFCSFPGHFAIMQGTFTLS